MACAILAKAWLSGSPIDGLEPPAAHCSSRSPLAVADTQANIEAQIAATEAVYLDETHTTGNVLKGFENYLKPPGTHHRRRADNEEERLFSGSSVVSISLSYYFYLELTPRNSSRSNTDSPILRVDTGSEEEQWERRRRESPAQAQPSLGHHVSRIIYA